METHVTVVSFACPGSILSESDPRTLHHTSEAKAALNLDPSETEIMKQAHEDEPRKRESSPWRMVHCESQQAPQSSQAYRAKVPKVARRLMAAAFILSFSLRFDRLQLFLSNA